MRAITAWSAFGSFDWGSLVTVPTGRYEAGIFEVRTDPPVEALLADLIRGLAIGRPDHPALDQPGWWERPERLRVPPPVLFHSLTTRAIANE